IFKLLSLLLFAVGTATCFFFPVNCNRFCKNQFGIFYCCETPPPKPPPPPPPPRKGSCPPVIKTFCGWNEPSGFGGIENFFSPPKKCVSDDDCCFPKLKCCYDFCIRDHVCKPSVHH
ncbi:hypothetical protein Anas_11131, partial [Armadillidium nasatum]